MGVKEDGNILHLFPPDTFQYVYNIQNLTIVMNRINGIKNKTINSGLREPNLSTFGSLCSFKATLSLKKNISLPQDKVLIMYR